MSVPSTQALDTSQAEIVNHAVPVEAFEPGLRLPHGSRHHHGPSKHDSKEETEEGGIYLEMLRWRVHIDMPFPEHEEIAGGSFEIDHRMHRVHSI